MLISRNTPKDAILEHTKGRCKQCGHCCSLGSGIVLKEEVHSLAKALGVSEAQLIEHALEPFTKFHTTHYRIKQVRFGNAPHGRCAFYDMETQECSINNHKPLHCRISLCSVEGEELQKWFDLKHFVNPKDPQSVREYALYLEFKEPLLGGGAGSFAPKGGIKENNELRGDLNGFTIHKGNWD